MNKQQEYGIVTPIIKGLLINPTRNIKEAVYIYNTTSKSSNLKFILMNQLVKEY